MKPKAESGVVYFNHGTKHCARLVVSLSTLRRTGYHGPVAILDTGHESATGILSQIVAEFKVRTVRVPLQQHRRHSAYVTKSTLWRHSPFRVSLFLDADTIVLRDPTAMLDWATDPAGPGIVVPRFGRWDTHHKIIKHRLSQWAKIKASKTNVQSLLRRALDHPWPAVNTGVVAWRKDAKILPVWEDLCKCGWRASFTDELAMQLLMTTFDHVLVADRYNWTPIYGQAPLDEVAVVHCHGQKHCRRKEMADLWLPEFWRAITDDTAGIKDWAPAGDKRLAVYLAEMDQEMGIQTKQKKQAA